MRTWALLFPVAPAAIIAMGETAGVGSEPNCSSSSEENCRSSRCCRLPGHQCYTKDEAWAACKATCYPGEIDLTDPETFQTPWSCHALGPRAEGNATSGLSPNLSFPVSFEQWPHGDCPPGWVCKGKDTMVCRLGSKSRSCNIPRVGYVEGKHFIALGRDFGTGSATSPRFILPHKIDRIQFRRSGGAGKGSGLYVHLMNGDPVCRAENGTNTNVFFLSWCRGLAGHSGKAAFIRIRDSAEGYWGKVLVDDIRLQDADGNDLPVGHEAATMSTVTSRVMLTVNTSKPPAFAEPADPEEAVIKKMQEACGGTFVPQQQACRDNVASLAPAMALYFQDLEEQNLNKSDSTIMFA